MIEQGIKLPTESAKPKRTDAIRLMPKQWEFVLDDEHRELMLSGAYGSGKSYPLCVRALIKARHKGARVCITRKTHRSLLATTVRTLLEPAGDKPPILPEHTYTYKEHKGRIFLRGGGEIVLRGCDNELALGSEEFSDILIDEGIELTEAEYIMLLGRLRLSYTLPDGSKNTRSIGTCTNPGSPIHFLYPRFIGNPEPGTKVWHTCTAENKHLPEDYVESGNRLTGSFRERYFLGHWVAMEGAIYPMFRSDLHVLHDPGPFDYYVAGVDYGYVHASVIRVHGCRYGSLASHVVSEYYASATTSPELVAIAQEAAGRFSPITFVVDPSAADLRSQMVKADLHAVIADNDVMPGIRAVQGDLSCEGGPPQLTFEPGLKGNDEYPAYHWAVDRSGVAKEQPKKEFDDAVDADRYARMYLNKGGAYGPRGFVHLHMTGPSILDQRTQEQRERAGIPKPVPRIDADDDRWWGSQQEAVA